MYVQLGLTWWWSHVVMVGGSLGLAVVCLPDPASGLTVACRFASGEVVAVRAFGLTRMAARHPNCYSVLACRVPARDYAQSSSMAHSGDGDFFPWLRIIIFFSRSGEILF